MAKVAITKALNGFFNVEGDTGSLGDGIAYTVIGKGDNARMFTTPIGRSSKRPASDFLAELKALSVEEKRELAELVCAATGDTLM